MTPEELIKQRKQRELLAKAAQAKASAPTDAKKFVSDATKESLKSAGRLAASLGKTLAERTTQAAAGAAEKGREAQEALARRAEEVKAKKDAEVAAQSALELQAAQPDQCLSTPQTLPEQDVLEPAHGVETARGGSSVDAASVPPEPARHPETAETSQSTRSEPEPLVVSLPTSSSRPDRSPPVPASAAPPPQTEPAQRRSKPTHQASAVPQQAHTRLGWHRAALMGAVVLAVTGAMAWWLVSRPSPPVSVPLPSSATDASASVAASGVEPQMVSRTQPDETARPASVPVKEKAVVSVPKANEPMPGAAIRPQRPETPVAPAPRPVAAPSPRPVPKPTAVAPVATPPEVERRTDWHEQANSDIDAWAEKIK